MNSRESFDFIAECADLNFVPEAFIAELCDRAIDHKLELLQWVVFVFADLITEDLYIVVKEKIEKLQNGLMKCRKVK